MSHQLRTGIFVAGLLAIVPQAVDAQGRPPVERVRSAYGRLERDEIPKIIEGPVTARFRASYKSDRSCEDKIQDQHYASSMFVFGQDFKITDVSVSTAEDGGKGQRVIARYKQFGKPDRRTFIFVKTGSDWSLDDVIIGGKSLRSAMSEPCPKI